MKYFILLMMICGSLMSYGQDQVSLSLVIRNFDHAQGEVRAGLYNSPDQWLEEAFLEIDTLIYSTGEVTLYFSNIPTGEYAIAIYHDENGNGDLDTFVMGIPVEDYAFSNNAVGAFGPASYEDAAFVISEDGTVHEVTLN